MRPVTAMVAWHANERELVSWLEEHVGPGVVNDTDAWRHEDIQWSMWSLMSPAMTRHVVEFRDAAMATMFKLRWG